MVLRQIPNKLLTFEQLGLPPVCEKLIMRPRGLFLVTGPTGSGKSTSLASMINYINENFDHHIITIEDPIEFYHYHKKSHGQPARGGRRCARASPKRSAARCGRIRTSSSSAKCATWKRSRRPSRRPKPGHIVFGTLHTTSAQGTVNRIIDVFPTQPAGTDSHAAFGRRSSASCRRRCCRKIGGGRVAAYEMLVVTPAIANLIRENKTFRINSAIQTGAKHGMLLLDDPLQSVEGRKMHEGRYPRQSCPHQ